MNGDRRKPTAAQQVQEMAASITDAAQFEEIIGKVDPKMKREVRRMLQQYVTFPVTDPLNPLAAPAPAEYLPTLVRKI